MISYHAAMTDQVVDATRAASLHADISRTQPLLAWVVLEDVLECPGKLIARLFTDLPTDYVLIADNLNDLRAQLPQHLRRLGHQPSSSPDFVETWTE